MKAPRPFLRIAAETEVELAVGPFTITPERETVCDFSAVVHTDDFAIMVIRPGLTNDMSSFLRTFTPLVWLLILCSFVGVIVALAGVVWAEDKVFALCINKLLDKVALSVIQIITQQGTNWVPTADGGRFVVITWILSSFVFMSSFSGILTAMLTVPRVTIPIDSLADLVAQTHLPWRVEAGSFINKFLMESGDPVRQKVVSRMAGFIPDCWTARQAVANGEYAAVCDETSMKKSMSWDYSTTGKCHLYIARQKVYSNAMMAVAFKVNSTFRSKADEIIMMVKESGLLERWMGTEITNTSQCLRPPTSDKRDTFSALSVQAFSGPFLVLAFDYPSHDEQDSAPHAGSAVSVGTTPYRSKQQRMTIY
ncbi:glutamate receptor ionotropic, kainate 2-like [Procambarus clarkii]|uniref:glutamate receptor ionotropic, kainate 2-like n=1 Tax=Procambarus clarkii TaxID=6728 RepID=UPI00374263C9